MRHEADVDDDGSSELMTWNDERGMGKKMEDDEDQQRQNHDDTIGHRVSLDIEQLVCILYDTIRL